MSHYRPKRFEVREKKASRRRLLWMLIAFTVVAILKAVSHRLEMAEPYLGTAEHASLLCELALLLTGRAG